MLDLFSNHHRIESIDQEDRALLRSNPSAWSMPEDGQGCMLNHMPLPSRSSFGSKAKNLLSWCEAPIGGKQAKSSAPVGHMSVLYNRWPNMHFSNEYISSFFIKESDK